MNTQAIVMCVCFTLLLLYNQAIEAQDDELYVDHVGKRRFPYKRIFKVFCTKQERFGMTCVYI